MTTTPRQKNALVSQYARVASRFTAPHRIHLSAEDYEELYADALWEVSRAIDAYDPARGYQMETIVRRYVVQAIRDYYRAHNSKKAKADAEMVRFSSLRRNGQPSETTGDAPIEAESITAWHGESLTGLEREAITQAVNVPSLLTPGERRVMLGILDGYTMAEIGRQNNRSKARMHQQKNNAVRKIRAWMGGGGRNGR